MMEHTLPAFQIKPLRVPAREPRKVLQQEPSRIGIFFQKTAAEPESLAMLLRNQRDWSTDREPHMTQNMHFVKLVTPNGFCNPRAATKNVHMTSETTLMDTSKALELLASIFL